MQAPAAHTSCEEGDPRPCAEDEEFLKEFFEGVLCAQDVTYPFNMPKHGASILRYSFISFQIYTCTYCVHASIYQYIPVHTVISCHLQVMGVSNGSNGSK